MLDKRDKANIVPDANQHIEKIFHDGELDENSTCAKFAQVGDNGKTISNDYIVYDVVDIYQSLFDIVTK